MSARRTSATKGLLIQVNIDWGWFRVQGELPIPPPGKVFWMGLGSAVTVLAELIHKVLAG